MHPLSRRDFLRVSGSAAGLLAYAASFDDPLARAALLEEEKAAAKKAGKNDVLRVACIGVHGQGKTHVAAYSRPGKDTVVAVICDADEGVIGEAMKTAEKNQGKAPKYVKDLREVFDDKSIDVVSIATPNHWHALAAIWAMQAGKDVYVEKPVCHEVAEGRRMVEASRRYQRVCQTGTQSRSQAGMIAAIDFILSGQVGKVRLARGLCYKRRDSIGKVEGEGKIPETCDYSLWCGPAPMKPLKRKRLHYDWHWVWDTGNGDIGNQGIHEMDKARWGLGVTTLPKGVISVGGRLGYEDDGQTPNTLVCAFDYGDRELIFEVRGLPSGNPYPGGVEKDKKRDPNYVGNVFYGADGFVVCPSYSSGVAFGKNGEVLKKFNGGGDHHGNFIEAVRKRRAGDFEAAVKHLHADIEQGHISSSLCHLGNISYRLGRQEAFAEKCAAFGDDKDAAEAYAKMLEHLKDNKVAVEATQYRAGRKLTFDPKAETFVNDREADALLTREYRAPFVVPAKI